MIALVSLMFVTMMTTVNSQCVNYTGTVCRNVIGYGPVFVDTATEAAFETYKQNYTALGVNVDAKCEAFLRAQYCGLSTLTCTGQVRCGPYNDEQIGQCGVNSCQCGSGLFQQACNAGLKIGFAALGGGLGYYRTGQQPAGMNCTVINIPCPPSAAIGLKFSLIGLLATTVITSLGVLIL